MKVVFVNPNFYDHDAWRAADAAVPARHDGAGHWHTFNRRVRQVLSFRCEFSFNWLAPAAF